MYEDTIGCNFDPNSMPESAESVLSLNPLPPPPPPQVLMPSPSETHNNNNNSFAVAENLRLSMEELSYPHQQDHHAAMEIELQNELGFNPYSTNTDQNNHSSHLVSFEQQTNWDNIHGVHDQMQQQLQDGANGAYPPTPDLLNLFSLPRCSPSSVLQNSSITFTNPNPKSSNFPNSLGFLGDVHGGIDTPPGTASSVLYDPLFHLNLPPQPPLFREMLQSLPHGYSLPGSRNGSLFSSGGDEREGIGEEGFTQMGLIMGDNLRMGCWITEKQRRVQLNGKYSALRNLVPNPTKTDRASIVRYAINYIKELLRLVEELKLLVEKKRCGRGRHQTEQDGGAGDGESCKPLGDPHDQSYNNGSLRSSWLQRKYKDTVVDVHIIDDEVTIKLVQKKKINLLLYMSKLLDELQLDLHHAAGEHIGNSYSFLFNTKMHEGSFLYTKAIGDKLIEVLDGQYAAVPPTSSY